MQQLSNACKKGEAREECLHSREGFSLLTYVAKATTDALNTWRGVFEPSVKVHRGDEAQRNRGALHNCGRSRESAVLDCKLGGVSSISGTLASVSGAFPTFAIQFIVFLLYQEKPAG